MTQDHLDLFFRTDVHFQIMLRAALRVPALNVLAKHDQGHQENLNHVRNKQPEHEAHWRIEAQRGRGQQIPTQPENRPAKDDQKEPDRTHPVGDPYRKFVEGPQVARFWLRIIAQRSAPFLEFFERWWTDKFSRGWDAHWTI